LEAACKLLRQRSANSYATVRGAAHPSLAAAAVNSWRFELAVSFAIFANCIAIGMETEASLGRAEDWRPALAAVEHVFTAGFTLELALRVLANGWAMLCSPPAALDAAVVLLTGALPMWVMPGLGVTQGWALDVLVAFRAFRIVRVVRVVQKVEALREIWLLMRGLKESLRVLCGTIVVIFFLTYIFAVFGVLLIGVKVKDTYQHASADEKLELEEVLALTDGVSAMMSTLIQVLTLDSWSGFVRVLIKFVPWSWAFFYTYIAVAVIVLMNLVTAVIVDNALKNSQQDADELVKDRERDVEQHMQRFCALFEAMDTDGSGTITRKEFDDAFQQPEVCNQLKLMDIGPTDCQELFSLLDSGDGELSLEEFFDGLKKIEGTAQARDVLRLQKTLDELVRSMVKRQGLPATSLESAEKCASVFSFVSPHASPLMSPKLQSCPAWSSSSPVPQTPSCGLAPDDVHSSAKMTRLDLHGVSSSQEEQKSSADLCVQKVDALFGELAELKTGLATVLQIIGSKVDHA